MRGIVVYILILIPTYKIWLSVSRLLVANILILTNTRKSIDILKKRELTNW